MPGAQANPGGRWQLLAAVAACASFALSAEAAAQTALLPDLRTQPHEVLEIGRKAGEPLSLRLSNTISNRGVGPLEIHPEQTAGDDCDGDGDPENDRRAFQRVYLDSTDPASPGYFIRDHDLQSAEQEVGCMIYHPEHAHWHFEDFSRYLLRSEASKLTVSRSTKVSFCVLDGALRFRRLPGAPADSYYGDPALNGCGPSSIEGISIGWTDTYGAWLAGQGLDLTGVPAGDYCLISRSDPTDRLDELEERNNGRRTRLFLDPATRTVERLAGRCRLKS